MALAIARGHDLKEKSLSAIGEGAIGKHKTVLIKGSHGEESKVLKKPQVAPNFITLNWTERGLLKT